jgi:hypothetical protein
MPNFLQIAPRPWGNVNWVRIEHYGVDGVLKMSQVVKNNRTNMGALWESNTLFGTVADGTIGCIGLTGTLFAPSGTETALLGEIATYGFSRIAATRQNYVAPTALNGTFTTDIYNQFMHTGTGTSVGIGMCALFNKTANGTLYALATFSQGAATLALGEQLAITWTVSS